MTIINTDKIFNDFLKENNIDKSNVSKAKLNSLYSEFLEVKLGFEPKDKEFMNDRLDDLYFLT